MLAERVSTASVEELQRRLVDGQSQENGGLPHLPDPVRQSIENKETPYPISCDEFISLFFELANRRYVMRGEVRKSDWALAVHAGICKNSTCANLFKKYEGYRELNDPEAIAKDLTDTRKQLDEKSKSPIVVNPVPFR